MPEPGNPLWISWLEEWEQKASKEQTENGHQTHLIFMIRRALKSLRQCPVRYEDPKDAAQLKYIGASTVRYLQSRTKDNPVARSPVEFTTTGKKNTQGSKSSKADKKNQSNSSLADLDVLQSLPPSTTSSPPTSSRIFSNIGSSPDPKSLLPYTKNSISQPPRKKATALHKDPIIKKMEKELSHGVLLIALYQSTVYEDEDKLEYSELSYRSMDLYNSCIQDDKNRSILGSIGQVDPKLDFSPIVYINDLVRQAQVTRTSERPVKFSLTDKGLTFGKTLAIQKTLNSTFKPSGKIKRPAEPGSPLEPPINSSATVEPQPSLLSSTLHRRQSTSSNGQYPNDTQNTPIGNTSKNTTGNLFLDLTTPNPVIPTSKNTTEIDSNCINLLDDSPSPSPSPKPKRRKPARKNKATSSSNDSMSFTGFSTSNSSSNSMNLVSFSNSFTNYTTTTVPTSTSMPMPMSTSSFSSFPQQQISPTSSVRGTTSALPGSLSQDVSTLTKSTPQPHQEPARPQVAPSKAKDKGKAKEKSTSVIERRMINTVEPLLTGSSNLSKLVIDSNMVETKNILLNPDEYEIILIVDTREIKGKKDRTGIYDELVKRGIKAEQRSLSLGDFMWIARPLQSLYIRGQEIALDGIIERKRINDLVHSILEGRYDEQRGRISKCGLLRRFYLLEHQPSKTSLALEDQYRKHISTVCSQIQVIDNFLLHHVYTFKQLIEYLSTIHETIIDIYKDKNISLVKNKGLSRLEFSDYFNGLQKKKQDEYHITYDAFQAMNSKEHTVRVGWAEMVSMVRGMSYEKTSGFLKRWPTPYSYWQDLKRKFVEVEDLEANPEPEPERPRKRAKKKAHPGETFVLEETKNEDVVRSVQNALSKTWWELTSKPSYN